MNEHDVLQWLVPAFASILCMIGLGIFQQLKKINGNLQTLSVDMAVIAERVNHHEKRINYLEKSR